MVRRNYLRPNMTTSLKLKRAYADLAADLSQVPPGGPAYPDLEALLAQIDAFHRKHLGKPVKEPAPIDRCGPGPTWAKTGLG